MNLIDPRYWLSLAPPDVFTPGGRAAFALFALMIIAGVTARVLSTSVKRVDRERYEIYARLGRLLFAMGLIGGFLYFLSYQNLRLLGARFWYPVWLVATLVWAFYVVRFMRRELPKRRQQASERALRDKYLPRRKRR